VTQRRLIESVVVCDVLLTAGTGALERYGPIDKRRGVFRPIVKDLLAIIERRRVLCCDLGLERKQRDVPTLAAYLKAKESDSKPVTIEAAS
jgi:hypothetical protein